MANRKQRRAANYVYHYTSTLALPWILMDGELQPSWRGGDNNHFIWATADPTAAPTAAPFREPIDDDDFLRAPRALVRLTLPGGVFTPWDVVKTMPPWTPQQAVEWEEHEETSKYHLRRNPLPLASVRRIDIRESGRWSRIRVTRDDCFMISDDPPTAGIRIDGLPFYSTVRFTVINGEGVFYYEVPDHTELREMWEEQQ